MNEEEEAEKKQKWIECYLQCMNPEGEIAKSIPYELKTRIASTAPSSKQIYKICSNNLIVQKC